MENNPPKHQFKAIKRTFEFESIYKSGKKVRLSNWLMVIFTDNASANLESDAKDQKNKLETFYGTTVSRKVGKAVLRNKLKRWVRNSAKIDVWPKRLCGKRSVFIFRPQGKEFYEKITFSDFKAALENLR